MQYKTEFFGHVVYSPELSYEDLLETEKAFQDAAMAILSEAGAQYINFNAFGDTLRVQCVFELFEEQLFHFICEAVAPMVDGKLEARFLFIDKELDNIAIYCIADKKWQENVLQIPVAGAIGGTLRKATLTE